MKQLFREGDGVPKEKAQFTCKNLPQSRWSTAPCPVWKRPRKISLLHLQAETTYQLNSQQDHRSVIFPLTPHHLQTVKLQQTPLSSLRKQSLDCLIHWLNNGFDAPVARIFLPLQTDLLAPPGMWLACRFSAEKLKLCILWQNKSKA